MPTHNSNECRIAACGCHVPSEAVHSGGMRDDDTGQWSRRRLLRTTFSGAAVGLAAGTGMGALLAPTRVFAQSTLSPDAALQRLMDGNRRFIERKPGFYAKDLEMLQKNAVTKHEPFASVLSCADARVPVGQLFDQSIGHVFVNRVAGNIATSEIIASIEYGVAVLGTPVLMVLGHSACGAVTASISANEVPGQISALYRSIRPAVDEAGGDIVKATKANARIQAKLLSESSPVVAAALKGGKLKVVAAYYDLASGEVSLVS